MINSKFSVTTLNYFYKKVGVVKKMYKNILSLFLLLSIFPSIVNAQTSVCDSDPNNIVQNCGFEMGDTQYWIEIGDWATEFAKIDFSAYSGSYSLSASNYPYQGYSGLSQTITDVSGQIYEVSFYATQNSNNNSQGLQLLASSINGNEYINLQDMSATNWTKYVFNFVGTGSDVFSIYGYQQHGMQYIDDINIHAISSVSSVPVPSAIWLFSSVFAGFSLFGRRKLI